MTNNSSAVTTDSNGSVKDLKAWNVTTLSPTTLATNVYGNLGIVHDNPLYAVGDVSAAIQDGEFTGVLAGKVLRKKLR